MDKLGNLFMGYVWYIWVRLDNRVGQGCSCAGAGPGDPSPIWFQSAGIELLFLCPWAGSRKPYQPRLCWGQLLCMLLELEKAFSKLRWGQLAKPFHPWPNSFGAPQNVVFSNFMFGFKKKFCTSNHPPTQPSFSRTWGQQWKQAKL